MGKLFDTLVPQAEASLRNWQAIQQQSQNSLSQIEGLLRKSENMMDSINHTLAATEGLAEQLRDIEAKGNSLSKELEERDEAVRKLKFQFQQIHDRDGLAEAGLFKAHESRTMAAYALVEGLSKEELMSWMEFTEQKQRDPIVLPKAFYENPEWQEELARLRQRLRTDELIPESTETNVEPTIRKEQKTPKQTQKGRSSDSNKQTQ